MASTRTPKPTVLVTHAQETSLLNEHKVGLQVIYETCVYTVTFYVERKAIQRAEKATNFFIK